MNPKNSLALPLAPLDPRVPTWDRAELEERGCPFCGSEPSGDVITRPDGLCVHTCGCGAMFVSPTPMPAALNAFYAAYSEHARWTEPDTARVRYMRAADPLGDYRTRRLAGMMDFSAARVLDVGFGQGADLVRYSQLGARVAGVDFDLDSVRFARERLGVDAYLGDVATFSPGHRFDLVSLHDVIEHPLDPVALLEQCAPHVRPGGLLSLWTPNGGHVDRDPDRVTLRVDLEHMQYLSASTIHQLASRLDWGVAHLESVGLPFLDSLGVGSRSAVKSLIKRTAPAKMLRWRASRKGNSAAWCSGSYHLFAVLRRPL